MISSTGMRKNWEMEAEQQGEGRRRLVPGAACLYGQTNCGHAEPRSTKPLP